MNGSGAIHSVTVLSVQGIGNTLLALPALSDLKAASRDIRITLVVGDEAQTRLFQRAGPVDLAVPLPRGPRLLSWLTRQRLSPPDTTLVTFPHGKASAWLSVLAGGRRVLHRAGGGPPWIGRGLVKIDRSLHDAEQNRALVRAMGFATGNDVRCAFDLPLDGAQRWRRETAGESRVAAIHPGCDARFPEKRWPADRFGELAGRLSRNGFLPVVVCGPDEDALAEAVVGAARGAAVRSPEGADLVSVAAMLACCDLFVGNDSGLMNLAVALGVPTVAVFGPSEFIRTRPLGGRSRTVRGQVDCSPCWTLGPAAGCPHDRFVCMEEVTVDAVAAAVDEIVDD